MKIAQVGEFGLIKCISSFCASSQEQGVVRGIGDDCAALKFDKPLVLVSTDLLIENVHFKRAWTTPFQLGFKSLAVSVSDIAAMRGIPRFFLLSISFPSSFTVQEVTELYAGARALAQKQGIHIIGGDTSASDKDTLFINGTILGEADDIVNRSGACVGDKIYITNPTGDSSAGLFLLQKMNTHVDLTKKHLVTETGEDLSAFISLIHRHLMPKPRFITHLQNVTSMIDVSDGLLQDLGHILDESKTGARVYLDRIPLSEPLKKMADTFDKDPYEFALKGGEDYELLFTSPDDIPGFYCIGEITKQGKTLIDHKGKSVSFGEKGGYDHFKNR